MLFRITLVFLFFTSFCFAQQDTINIVDKSGKKQGKWMKFYKNGNLRYVGHFNNNIATGKFYYYYEDGKPQALITHKNSKESYALMFHYNGKPMAQGKYYLQKKDSTWEYFSYHKGYLIAKESFISGKQYGKAIIYYPNGKIYQEKNFEADIEEGDVVQYYESGKQKMKAKYSKGALTGTAYYFHENGSVFIKGNYIKDYRQGLWIYYDTKGNVTKKETYEKGRCLDCPEELINDDPKDWIKKDWLDVEDMQKSDLRD